MGKCGGPAAKFRLAPPAPPMSRPVSDALLGKGRTVVAGIPSWLLVATSTKPRGEPAQFIQGGRLEARPSRIPNAGYGLFARSAIRRRQWIGEYSGERIGRQEALRRSEPGPHYSEYLFALGDGEHFVDGASMTNEMRWANSQPY